MPLPEKALIAQIRRLAASAAVLRANRKILTGIGDDCAILSLPPGHNTIVTTDFSLEGIHFRRDWHSPESIGHRCLARGLSDIAAMGGEPVAAFLSLALPRGLPSDWTTNFLRGLLRLAKKFHVTLAGGDTAQSPAGILADILVLGSVPQRKAILRSGARPGDKIYVSGELGGSAAAIWQLTKKPKAKLNPRDYQRHFLPEPRIELGRILRERALASAMIDTSDGLSTDLAHICEESGVGAELQAERIPRASVGNPAREVDLELALHGGEDYELLFTVPRNRRVPSQLAGSSITQIGEILPGKKIYLQTSTSRRQLHPQGWEHFRQGSM